MVAFVKKQYGTRLYLAMYVCSEIGLTTRSPANGRLSVNKKIEVVVEKHPTPFMEVNA
jgi:hypothetical protein